MVKIPRLLLLVMSGLLLTACYSSNNKPDDSGLMLCPEERSQICTREYNPVCATMRDGSVKTYSTGCTSCSDPSVVGYRMGEC